MPSAQAGDRVMTVLVAVAIALVVGLVFAAVAHFGGTALLRICESDPDD